ncbi:hypothetical protein CO058_00550 [candidate division WWE3 bacterium CG_4_9_14_0_2_um_filter_35_11]|uniref:Uncharacterized protein n=1 Tax=candidate division WWE3 bacterium CG_4_9_14_0_2_um_filter_35_11 TaxID=1975077 RepID=A0A2M8EMJ1_UNCKA|nr:MAG: hypothetical protein COV25_01365 [candidate division WWE3 bacterium CG10_big_fil_rev_8_21_14_0_10_35_32]PJC23966.1 MAG: hypothetical protein CO058_00550 [candidate division WWE3 bacterium CG_4_9_14_0_2_um_filter_35_11]
MIKISEFVDVVQSNVANFFKVKINRNLLNSVENGGVATIKISTTQIKGFIEDKQGKQTKLKRINIKVNN